MEKSHLTKRRKSKDNNPKEPYTEKNSKKRSDIKYDWRQTDSEVIVNFNYGPGLDESCYTLSSSNNHCAVKFRDGKEWECQFYRSVVDAGTTTECKGNHLYLMLIKDVPDVRWPQLEADSELSDGNQEKVFDGGSLLGITNDPLPPEEPTCLGMHQLTEMNLDGGTQTTESADDASPIEDDDVSLNDPISETDEIDTETLKPIEIPAVDIRKDFYEKALGIFVICLYVKSVSRDTVEVDIGEEQYLSVRFQTSDEKFIQKYTDANFGTRFVWRVTLKERIYTDKYDVECRANTVSLTFYKKDPHKKWDSIEAPADITLSRVSQVAPDTWVPVVKPATKATSATAIPLGYTALQSRPTLTSSDNIKKPTCMVSPMNKVTSMDLAVPPGLTGLENLGNTCFMNSVVQCLVNTREFRDYFLEMHFKKDINAWNPLGMGGKLALCFAILCTSLWNGIRRSIEPSHLKSLVSMKASQFTGFAQHDAQEFMAFLLDGLHEDLNRIEQRPYIETRDWDGRPDEVVANEAWEAYKKRNDSIVVDLFQGQYKSKLVCPVCGKVSITFDPFLYLSVPLPKRVRIIPVVFFSKDLSQQPYKYSARVPHDATADDLKEQLGKAFKVLAENLRVFEVYKNKIHRFLTKGHSLGSVRPTDIIFAFEVWSEKSVGEPVAEVNVVQRIIVPSGAARCSFCKRESPSGETTLRRCTKCRRASYCGQECQKSHWSVHKANCKYSPELIGLPFVVSLPKRKMTYYNLCQVMEAYARYSVDVFRPPVQAAETYHHGVSLSITENRGCGQSGAVAALDGIQTSENFNDPLETIQQSELFIDAAMGGDEVHNRTFPFLEQMPPTLNHPCEVAGPAIQVVFGQQRSGLKAEHWEPLFDVTPVNHCGITLTGSDGLRLEDKGDEPLDLSNCLYLALDWHNDEKAKSYVMVQTKELDLNTSEDERFGADENGNFTLDQCLTLFTEPEVLSPEEAWYCPRCRRHREATKQMELWRLPPILIVQLKRFSFKSLIWRDKIDKLVEYPIRGLDLSQYCCGPPVGPSNTPPIYDLYAVINHHGSILGGHYTSTARLLENNGSNRSEIGWRMFDDSHVTFTSEASAMNKLAYMLFYRRRDLPVRFDPVTRMSTTTPIKITTLRPTSEVVDELEDDYSEWTSSNRKNVSPTSCPDTRPAFVSMSKHNQ